MSVADPAPPTSPQELLDSALADRDTSLLAAAARAGAVVPRRARGVLAGLVHDGLDLHEAADDDRLILALSEAVTADPDGDHPPPVMSTPTVRRAMVALLAATRPANPGRPYPGRWATVETVLAVARPTSEPAERHLLGAMRRLSDLGFAVFSDDELSVRPGPQLVTWDDPWATDELPRLLDRLATP